MAAPVMQEQERPAVVPIRAEGPERAVYTLLDRREGRDGSPGTAYSSLANALTVLEQDSRWAQRVYASEHDGQVYVDEQPLTDGTEGDVAVWLDRVYGLRDIATSKVAEAIRQVAGRNKRHQLRQWLESLQWDGEGRASTWLSRYLGVVDSPLTQEIGLRFLVGCVARVLRPGCKLDTVLTLVGRQGAGKSRALRVLAHDPRYFADTLIDFRNKDAMQGLRGKWLWELAELDSVHRADQSAVKAFLSAQDDWFRPVYMRNHVRWPRQTVFVATTNEGSFLRDMTGSRRFWPVQVGEIDLEGLGAAVPQIWAEAMAWYGSGEPWWLSPQGEATLAEASEQFEQDQPWEPALRKWLYDRVQPFAIAEAMEVLGFDAAQQQRFAGTVADLLRRLGCTKARPQRGGDRKMLWFPAGVGP